MKNIFISLLLVFAFLYPTNSYGRSEGAFFGGLATGMATGLIFSNAANSNKTVVVTDKTNNAMAAVKNLEQAVRVDLTILRDKISDLKDRISKLENTIDRIKFRLDRLEKK